MNPSSAPVRRPFCLVPLVLLGALAACGGDDDTVRVVPDVAAPASRSRVVPEGCVADPGDGVVRYRVERGDTLSGIARRVYGDEALWREIVRANPDRVRDGKTIRVGDELVIPFEGR